MTDSKQILEDLYQLKKSLPQNQLESFAKSNPVTKLDEVNTILHIYAIREEIQKTTDEKHREDCQKALVELEIHYQELQRKNKPTLRSMSFNMDIE